MANYQHKQFSAVFKLSKQYIISIIIVLTAYDIQAAPKTACLNFHVIQSEPLGYLTTAGKPTGIHWDYLEAVKKHSGLCINLELKPYARVWEDIKHGKHDGGIIFKSQSRSYMVEYVEQIQTVPIVVIPINGITINRYQELRGLAIGAMRGAHQSQKFDKDENLNVIRLLNYEQEIQMINLKRIDAIAGSHYALVYQLEKYDVLNKVDVEGQLKLGDKEQWLQLSKKSKHLEKIPFLRTSIKHLKNNGTFNDILSKYYRDTYNDNNQETHN